MGRPVISKGPTNGNSIEILACSTPSRRMRKSLYTPQNMFPRIKWHMPPNIFFESVLSQSLTMFRIRFSISSLYGMIHASQPRTPLESAGRNHSIDPIKRPVFASLNTKLGVAGGCQPGANSSSCSIPILRTFPHHGKRRRASSPPFEPQFEHPYEQPLKGLEKRFPFLSPFPKPPRSGNEVHAHIKRRPPHLDEHRVGRPYCCFRNSTLGFRGQCGRFTGPPSFLTARPSSVISFIIV